MVAALLISTVDSGLMCPDPTPRRDVIAFPAWIRVWNTSQCLISFHAFKCVPDSKVLKCLTLKNIKGPCAFCPW